jgi:aminopeptidase YwaD
MINFDMVGVGEYFDLYTADGTDATGLQKSMIAVLERMGHTPAISKTERSDHTPFSYSGIQAVDVQMSPPGHYHTDFDNIDAIQPELLEKVCEFGIRVLTEELVTWVE